MQYMILIYGDEKAAPPATTAEEMAAMMQPWNDYTAAMKAAGVFLAGDALQPTDTATSVTAVSGETVFTDGPFAETKEQLGGYYLIECPNLDQAMHWAAKCPGTAYGTIELRPVMLFG